MKTIRDNENASNPISKQQLGFGVGGFLTLLSVVVHFAAFNTVSLVFSVVLAMMALCVIGYVLTAKKPSHQKSRLPWLMPCLYLIALVVAWAISPALSAFQNLLLWPTMLSLMLLSVAACGVFYQYDYIALPFPVKALSSRDSTSDDSDYFNVHVLGSDDDLKLEASLGGADDQGPGLD